MLKEKTPIKTKSQILDDVVKHIKNQGGQAVSNNDTCQYITEDGKNCGHSMALKPEYRVKANEMQEGSTAVDVINEFGDKVHKKRYRGHSKQFWTDIQYFHDNGIYWNKDGSITEKGNERLRELKESYS